MRKLTAKVDLNYRLIRRHNYRVRMVEIRLKKQECRINLLLLPVRLENAKLKILLSNALSELQAIKQRNAMQTPQDQEL